MLAGRALLLIGVYCLTGAIASSQESASFKTGIELVLVPVIVRDAEGHDAANLSKEDFLILDRGKRQTIKTFSIQRRERDRGGPQDTARPQIESTTAAQRYIAFLFDDVQLGAGELARVRDVADRYVATSLPETDRAAIFTTSGQTVLDFTPDRNKLRDAIRAIQSRPISTPGQTGCPNLSYHKADLIVNQRDEQTLKAAIDETIDCLNLGPQIALATRKVKEVAASTLTSGDWGARASLSALKGAVRRLSALPAQRTIIMVSPGFLLLNQARPDEAQVVDRAIHANVVINVLDAHGLYAVSPGGDAGTKSYSVRTTNAKTQDLRDTANLSTGVLADLAAATGGTFFHNSNDQGEGFRRVAGAAGLLYVLGFSPQDMKLDGSFHALKVKLKFANNLTIQARSGYYALPQPAPAETAQRDIEDALFFRAAVHDFPLEVHTQPGDRANSIAVQVHVDLKALHLKEVNGVNEDDLTVVFGLFDNRRKYIDATKQVVEIRVTDDRRESAEKSGVTLKERFDVNPGSYMVRVVARDAEGQMMSVGDSTLRVP